MHQCTIIRIYQSNTAFKLSHCTNKNDYGENIYKRSKEKLGYSVGESYCRQDARS